MKKGAKIALSVLGGIAIVATSLYFFVKNQAKLLMDYCYGIVGGKVNELSFKNIDVDLVLEIGNKSILDFIIKGYLFDITLNGASIIKLKSASENQLIKSESISYLKLKVVFNPQTSLQNVLTPQTISLLLSNPDNMVIGINGVISVDTSIVTINDLPINISTTIKEIRTGTGETKNRKCSRG